MLIKKDHTKSLHGEKQMNKLFFVLPLVCLAIGNILNANIISYDPITGNYTVDQYGAPIQFPHKEKSKFSLPSEEKEVKNWRQDQTPFPHTQGELRKMD